MAKDFEQIGYKNFELLRFYISKDIRSINGKSKEDNSEIISCFVGSLVDVLVVLLFNDTLNRILACLSFFMQITIKILCILGLLCLFFIVQKLFAHIQKEIYRRESESGKIVYNKKDKQAEIIDSFDNIACDGLLICQNYIEKYESENRDYLKTFYLYEIIHHLYKAESIFNLIIESPELYISSKDDKIGSYRIENFIIFAQCVVKFVKEKVSLPVQNSDLDQIINHLIDSIEKWDSKKWKK